MSVEHASREARPVERALSGFRRRAEDEGLVDIAYGMVDSPVGRLTLAATDAGLVRIGFSDESERVLDELALRISPRVLRSPRRIDPARRELEQYFDGKLHEFTAPLDWRLVGPFGRRVLGRTAGIPYGSLATYNEIAREIGAPGAARAVGNALGANPIPVIVPCHRVVRTGGALGGYGGGLPRKAWLLQLEGVPLPGSGRAATSPGAARSG